MAHISFNPIGWQTDQLFTQASGVISTADTYPCDLTRAEKVLGITVSGSQPPSTERYAAFKLNGSWGKLTSAGQFAAFTENNINIDNLKANGNTPSELTALTDIPALAGKQFGVALGLIALNPNDALPTMGLTFKCRNSTQQLAATRYSPVYELGENAQIISITGTKDCSAGGTVELLAQGTLSNGEKTAWKSIETFIGEKVKSVQIRGDYRVPAIGNAYARITECEVLYSDGSTVTSGMSDGEIVTKTQDWYMPIKSCRATLRHNELESSTLKVYAAFRNAPQSVKGETLGIGTGSRKTFELGRKNGICYDTFKLYADGVQVFSNYELNCEAGRVTYEAPAGTLLACDYEYGWESEDWQELNLSSRWDMGDYVKSEYRLSIPENTKTAAALKIIMGTTAGRINSEVLGTGTGTSRTYLLSRTVKDGVITIYAGNAAVASKNWHLHDDNRHITIAAPAGLQIRANYDWISTSPRVSQFEAVFSE